MGYDLTDVICGITIMNKTIQKCLLRLYEIGYKRTHRHRYTRLHSSDAFLPHKGGATGHQLTVVSRLMDTEMIFDGRNPYYHILNSDRDPDKWNAQYIKFIQSLEQNGFDHDNFMGDMAVYGVCGLGGGTHRLGYLLYKNPNFFLKTELHSAEYKSQINGDTFFREIGASSETINELTDRYYELVKHLRNQLSAIVLSESVSKIEALSERIDGINSIIRVSELSYGDIPKAYRRHLHKGRSYELIHIEVSYHELRYEYCRLRSVIINELVENLDDFTGYFCHTIAESVDMDNKLNPLTANIYE